ncbi:MAG TPA: SDR family oxidoreductase [Bacteroidia bacterium]|jgi:dTDP-4-dehydrorhamnose reductase|nr:SDR family oxidoreductase [Bacteroidia bacterium]
MNKKIFITGSNGLLGQKLVYRLLKQPNVTVIAASKGPNRITQKDGYIYEELDITNPEEVKTIIKRHAPDVLINTAAMTDVDGCESKPVECHKINVDAVEYIISALKELHNNPQLIHLSTDFIFDGKHGPYKETDIPYPPQSVYSQSKYVSEKVVFASGLKWTIIRTVLVYGIVDNMSRSNIVLVAKNNLSKGKQMKVVDDQFRTPTLAEDLAEGCALAALKGATGIYHISGKDFMSVLELFHKVADFWHLNKSLLTSVNTATLAQAAQRPLRTGFILDKAINELGYAPHSFTEGLQMVDRQLKEKGI